MPVRHPSGDISLTIGTEERDLEWKHKFGNCYHKGVLSQEISMGEIEEKR